MSNLTYGQIHSTLSSGQNLQQGPKLRVGNIVKNLLPQVSNVSTFAPYFNLPNVDNTKVYRRITYGKFTDIKIIDDKIVNNNEEMSFDNYIASTLAEGKKDSWHESFPVKRITKTDIGNDKIISYNPSEEEGSVFISTTLKSKTVYKIQIINNSKTCLKNFPNTTETLSNIHLKWIDKNNRSKTLDLIFNNSLYFQTPETISIPVAMDKLDNSESTEEPVEKSTEVTLTLEVPGITPSFSDLDNRRWRSVLKPKIFLFETDAPWVVSPQGEIISISNELLLSTESVDLEEVILPFYNEEKIREFLLQETPTFTFTKNNLQVNIPEFLDKSIADYDEKFLNQIFLMPIRNYLGKRKRKNKYGEWDSQYGNIHSIQNTVGEQPSTIKLSIQVDPYLWLKDMQEVSSASPWEVLDKYEYKMLKAGTWENNDFRKISLPLLSCLGYNNNMLTLSDCKKYTSISFAWACYDELNHVQILSQISEPIIIARDLCTFNKIKISTETPTVELDGVEMILKNIQITRKINSAYSDNNYIYIESIK